MTKRAAIYVRVSSSHQEKEGASLKTQEKACRAHAVQQGWRVDEEYVYRETHKRWLLHERPEMTRLRDAARAGEFDVVVCYCVDRLSSQDAHVYILTEEFEKAEVELAFATETFEDSALGRFIRSAKVFTAAVEVEKISERTVRGRLSRVRDKGFLIPGGKPLYGYQWADERDHKGRLIKGRLVEDPDTAPVVRRVFTEIASGTTLRQLAMALTRECVPTPTGRGQVWHTGTLANMLHHPGYKGEAYAWGIRKGRSRPQDFDHDAAIKLPDGTIPPLVDAALWDAVQVILERNKQRSIRSAKDPEAALLRGGYVKCGVCGSSMYPRPRSNGAYEYVCKKGSDHPGLCIRPSISTRKLDTAVWAQVAEVLLDPDIIRREIERQQTEGFEPLEDKIAVVEGAIGKLAKQQDLTARAVATMNDLEAAAPLVSRLEDFAEQKRDLVSELDRLTSARDAWKTQQADLSDLETWCSTVAANLDELTYQQKRLALDVLGISVAVWRADHDPRYSITSEIQSASLSSTT